MCLAQGPQRNDAGEAQTRSTGLEDSILEIQHRKRVNIMNTIKFPNVTL